MMQLELIEQIESISTTHKAESYTGLYGLHKYWGKKPFNIMANFIKKYSKPGDIILDPFCGSGVTISESVFNNRKGIGVDINPSSILITNQVINRVDTKAVIFEFLKIEKELKNEINKFYAVIRNGISYQGENFLWENEQLKEVRYNEGKRKRASEVPSEFDIQLAEKVKYEEIKHFIPRTPFFHNSRINAYRTKKIYELFTPRNLLSLSLLLEKIEQIENLELRDFFLFCFTSAIGQASKMVFVIKRRNKTKIKNSEKIEEKKEIGSWVIGYWAPKEYFENNPWTCFESRFKKILKAKQKQETSTKKYLRAPDYFSLKNEFDFLLVNEPSQKYLQNLPDNSIDYILTDPPHGNRIPYLELSMLWNSWLKKDVNYEDEIIISDAKERCKGISQYNDLMKIVFEQCHRILKIGGRLSFMFNGLDDVAWIHSVEMFNKLGFKLERIETLGYSANSVVQDNRENGLQTDFIITYIKEKENQFYRNIEIIDINFNIEIKNQINSLKKSGNKPFEIMNLIMSQLLMEHKFLKVSELINSITYE
jgi:DNA modification methylase